MEQVFAPWRIEWVERESSAPEVDCVFCAFAESDADCENRVLARSERAYVLLNNYPYNPGHAMVVPRDHVGDPRGLDEETVLERERLVARTLDALDDAMAPDGYNVGANLGSGAAGGSIGDHVHTHVVPRWEGDTNFMPVISETTVIVEAVADTYDRLHEAFAGQDETSVPGEGRAVVVE
jgi:ATP adenylyltransferase